jgi:hypothetical protein
VKTPLLIIDRPNFEVKLYKDVIEVDLKTGVIKDFENLIESNPVTSKAHRLVSCPIFPSDVDLCEIDSVEVNEQGQVKLVLPWERDITIPLEPEEAYKLSKKLNELILLAKIKKEET